MIGLLLGGWRVGLAGLAAGLIMGGGGTWWLRDQMAAHAALHAVQHTVQTVQRQSQTTSRVEARTIAAQERVRTVTRTIIQEVPHVIPVEVDRAFGGLPVGLLRVYNASGEGRDLSAFPDPAGRPDAAASDVLTSTFAAIAANNNGAANECREQVIGLQSWITEQARIH